MNVLMDENRSLKLNTRIDPGVRHNAASDNMDYDNLYFKNKITTKKTLDINLLTP